MPSLKIVHMADLHLDSPFQGLSRRDEELAKKFRQASLGAFSRAISFALEHEVDLVTVGGDCFDGLDRSLHAQWYLRNEFRRLNDAGIPTLLVAGNHDPVTDWSQEMDLPESVHFFPPDEVTVYSLLKEGRPAAEIFGISYGVREVGDNLAKKFPSSTGELARIGLLHANVGARTEHAAYAPATVADLAGRGMDVWLLGHVHKPEIIRESDPLIIYPGCTQGRDIGETGRRGCYLVSLEGRRAEASFIPTAVIRWETVTVATEAESSLMELADRLIEAGEERLSGLEPGEDGLVVRWRLTGRSALKRDLSTLEGQAAVEGLLTEAFADRSPYLLTESIKVDLKGTIDPESFRGRQDIVGDLVELAASAETSPEWREELVRALDPVFESDSQGRRHIVKVDDDEFRELLEKAVKLGLDRLLPEEL